MGSFCGRCGARLRVFAALAFFSVAACVTAQPRQTEFMKSRGVRISEEELRARVFEFGRHFIGIVEETAAQVAEEAQDDNAHDNVLRWQAGVVPLIEEASLRDDPLLSLGDLFALCIQQHDFFLAGAGSSAFGPQQGIVVAATDRLVGDAGQIAVEVVGAKSHANARAAVEAWAKNHPIRSLLFTRESAMSTWAAALGDERGGCSLLLVALTTKLGKC